MHSGFLTTTKDDDGTSINPASRNLFNRSGSTPTLGPRSSAIHKRGASSGSNMRSYSSLLAALEDQAPYQQYRARQRRDAAMGESVWDDEMEAAFMEADRNIPNIGRTRLNVEGKISGRNELIAEYIFKLTGKRRNRKQVSSHIQVLKKLLMDFASTKNRIKQPSPQDPISWSPDALSPSTYSEPTPPLRPQQLPERPHSSIGYTSYNCFASPPPSASQSQCNFARRNAEIASFVMMVGTDSSHMGRDIDCVSHTYTQLSREESQRTPPVYMSSIDSWRTRFPSVADLIDTDDATGHNLQNTCTMLHIHSTISTSSVEAPPQSLMCTKLEVSLPDGELLDCQWDCVTRIYAAGKKIPVWELPHTPLRLSEDPATGSRSLKLPFASDFWRAFYNRLSQAAGNSDEENNAIKGVTVVQELFSTSILGDKNRSTLLMWDFSKAAPGAPGKAVWKEVLRNPTNLLSVDSNAEASGTTWTIAQPARLPMSPSPYDDLTYFRYDEQAYPGTPMHVPTISLDNTGYYHDSQDGCFEAYTGFEQYRGGLQFGHGSSY